MEKGVVEFAHFRATRGMCVGVPELRFILMDTANFYGIVVPENFPDRHWMSRFLKRHPSLSIRQSQLLDVSRYRVSTVDVVTAYYNNLASIIGQFPPEAIWNADETGICAQGRRPPRVICPKGLRANVVRSTDRENVSILACISAAGAALPPMYIYAGPCDGAPFSVFKRKIEKAISIFPGKNRGALPTRDDLAALSCQPWLEAVTASNITSAFAKCGIWPLNLDQMKADIVGKAPEAGSLVSTMPNVAAALENLAPLMVTKRLQKVWDRKGLSREAVTVANRNLDRFMSTWDVKTKPKTGQFIPEKEAKMLTGGGYLITREDMLALLAEQQETKRLKSEGVAKRRVERETKKAAKLSEKSAKLAKKSAKLAGKSVNISRKVAVDSKPATIEIVV
ncbi:hypothetical protein ACHHYP_11708 [Achlya hypogyna]|uniref:HTH CENPB-type domain-containing protein n=1 Tax=Achlya hypogyna TaxID=1202772 RepID=A0A1V9YIP7_ACHHY|nr:hypothetical protein ACHHYP_11708 [Achlya hypogyna]